MKQNSESLLADVAVIQAGVAMAFGLPVVVLAGRNAQRQYSRPRHVVMLLCQQLLVTASLPAIARALDRDHTTVIAGIRAIKEHLKRDRGLAEKVEALKTVLAPQMMPDSTNHELSQHLARQLGRDIGAGIGEVVAAQVAKVLQPYLKQIIASTAKPGDAS